LHLFDDIRVPIKKEDLKLDEIKDLLAYCRLDTLAMVRIWERLREIL